MPEMTIRLICDKQTGKKNIIISLDGDEDALPQEHEQLHKAVVEKLLGKGLIKGKEIGQVTVERQEEAKGPAPTTANQQEQRQAVGQGH